MKNIFTYPNNAGTNYIAPSYVGNATTGFEKRVDDLRTGAYRAWQGNNPIATGSTNDAIMSNTARFYNAFQESWGQVTFNKLWEKPMIVKDTELIQSNISDAQVGNLVDVVINFSGNHGFYEDQLMKLTGFDGSLAELNNQELYVNKIDADTIKLTKTPGGLPIQLFQGVVGNITWIDDANTFGPSAITVNVTNDSFTNGDLIRFDNVNGQWASILNGNQFYVEVINATQIRLHDTPSLNNEIAVYNLANQNLTSGTIGSPVVFSHNGTGGLAEDMKVNVTGLNGTIGDRYNNQTLYVQNLTGTTLNLSTDQAGTNLIGLPADDNTSIITVSVNADDTIHITVPPTEHDYLNGSAVDIDFTLEADQILTSTTGSLGAVNWFNGHNVSANGQTIATYYTKRLNDTTYNNEIKIYNWNGSNYVFGKTDTIRTQTGIDIGEVPTSGSSSVVFISADGNTVAIQEFTRYGVGNPQYSKIYIYSKVGGVWSTTPQEIDGPYESSTGHILAGLSDDGLTLLSVRYAGQDGQVWDRPDVSSPFVGVRPLTGNFLNGTSPRMALSGNGLRVIGRDIADDTEVEVWQKGYLTPGEWSSLPYDKFTVDAGASGIMSLDYTGEYAMLSYDNIGEKHFYTRLSNYVWTKVVKSGFPISCGNILTSNGNYIHAGAFGGSPMIKDTTTGEWYAPSSISNPVGAPSVYDNNGNYVLSRQTFDGAYLEYFTEQDAKQRVYALLDGQTKYLQLSGGSTYKLYDNVGLSTPTTWQTALGSTVTADIYVSAPSTTTAYVYNIPYVASTAGYLEEVDETGPNYTAVVNPTATTTGDFIQSAQAGSENLYGIVGDPNIPSTTGTLTISESANARYRLSAGYPYIVLPGNTQYLQRTGESTYVPNCLVHTSYAWVPSSSGGYPQSFDIWPYPFDVYEDSNGRIIATSPLESEFPGAINNSDSVMFDFYTEADTYTPPGQTPAEQQDNWDTASEWDNTGVNFTKEWPRHVSPASAKLRYEQPNTVTRSMSGKKYVRNSGHTNWYLDVAYPPMTEAQFREFNAMVMSVRGQYHPFFFVNQDKNGQQLLLDFSRPENPGELKVKEYVPAGSTTVLLEGFSSFAYNALAKGELVITGSENGNIRTVINQVNSNAYGEALMKLAYPTKYALNVGDSVFFNPYHFVVTLADDGFEYDIDTAGYYYVNVSFEFDEFR